MTRTIILKKVIDDTKIIGFFITESTCKNKSTTRVQTVSANTINKHVGYLLNEVLEGLEGDNLIKKYLKKDYYIRKDETNESNGKGFRVINNLTHKVIGSYNWEVAI
ncbi:hypothetical protein [Clostridium estertheticum]|uniref:hypothetical protein n=1 Tax=Clostridium estertheticum TaxID=238834 RepID=UPI001C0D4B2C|nr:hypothetical protein [Clostridium estertheticum]MBU3186614.1 hypothetical protein [Clostridium estertheticum]